jgi:hypothetical protein
MFALVHERRSKKKGSGDSFSPIITANDLAAAWASDPDGDSLYSLVPGGERQHELALRGGVKSGDVHAQRQLQIRPGSCARFAGALGASNGQGFDGGSALVSSALRQTRSFKRVESSSRHFRLARQAEPQQNEAGPDTYLGFERAIRWDDHPASS